MVSLSSWFRYVVQKLEYSITVKNYKFGKIIDPKVGDAIWKNMFQGKLTYIGKGNLAPDLGETLVTSLIRKIPAADPRHVHVGDLVAYKNREKADMIIIGKLAGTEGDEMVSTDEKDEPFILERDQCWILAHEDMKLKDARDSRTYGPMSMSGDIVGRVIYYLTSAEIHGPVPNSRASMKRDAPILEVELDVDELKKSQQP